MDYCRKSLEMADPVARESIKWLFNLKKVREGPSDKWETS